MMMSVSVDGFMSDPDGGLGWQIVDAELHQHFNDWLGTAGAFLDGRVSYELMAGFWPHADADPASSSQVAEFAGIWRDMPKIVYSTTLEHAEWNATVRREVGVDEIRELQREDGGDLVLGGANLAASFRALDLVDEYRLYVHPVLLGRGVPLFGGSDTRTDLALVESRTFGSGVTMLRYARISRPD